MEGSPKFAESQTLPDIDYAAFARSLGLAGVNIDKPEQLGKAWDEALSADRPTVLDVRCDPERAADPATRHPRADQVPGRRRAARRRGHLGLRQTGPQTEGAAVPARPQGRSTDMRAPRKVADARDRPGGQPRVHDVRTGRFERTLAALTAAGAAVTAAEIYLSHDGASFGNKMMWWPIVVVPTAIPAGVAAVVSPRAAHTVLPLTSAAIVVNGLQGHLSALARHRATSRRHHPLQPRGRPARVRAAARLAGRAAWGCWPPSCAAKAPHRAPRRAPRTARSSRSGRRSGS